VPFYFGTHYIALHMLEASAARGDQAMPRAERSRYRLAALMKGELDGHHV